ncbi:MAG: hypothetical protein RL326_1829 [Pseudomonadota bacterium]
MAPSMNVRFLLPILTVIAIIGCSSKQETSANGGTAKTEVSTKEQREFIERQKEEMRKQERELQDLRRQKFQDDYFRSQYQK